MSDNFGTKSRLNFFGFLPETHIPTEQYKEYPQPEASHDFGYEIGGCSILGPQNLVHTLEAMATSSVGADKSIMIQDVQHDIAWDIRTSICNNAAAPTSLSGVQPVFSIMSSVAI